MWTCKVQPVWNQWQLLRRDYIFSPLARLLDCTTHARLLSVKQNGSYNLKWSLWKKVMLCTCIPVSVIISEIFPGFTVLSPKKKILHWIARLSASPLDCTPQRVYWALQALLMHSWRLSCTTGSFARLIFLVARTKFQSGNTKLLVVKFNCDNMEALNPQKWNVCLTVLVRILNYCAVHICNIYIACLHDQNKCGFFGRPAFIQSIGTIWKVLKKLDWLDESRPSKIATFVLIMLIVLQKNLSCKLPKQIIKS